MREYKIRINNMLPIPMKYSLVELGFIVNDKPITFNKFKELATILKYGRGKNANFITYFGVPRVKMLKIYSFICSVNQNDNLKEAYRVLCECASGNDEFDNCEINLCTRYSITY